MLSSDFVHSLGLHEPRYQVINPQIRPICDPLFPGSTPASPLCVRGASSRTLDRAFVNAGYPIQGANARVNQINMFGTTNRSRFDSWTTTLRGRYRWATFSASYVLANSKSWGGQPVASYTGNGIAIVPDNQFKDGEYGPTRFDERHRIVASGVFEVGWGFQVSPIVQFATARPYSLATGVDIDGDGLVMIDRICQNTSIASVFAARGDSAAVQNLNPRGCRQLDVNSQRNGFIVGTGGAIEERDGKFINVDVRLSKGFNITEDVRIRGYVDLYNLFNRENLSYSNRFGLSTATSASQFMQPFSLYGPGFGPPVGRPFTMQLGARIDF